MCIQDKTFIEEQLTILQRMVTGYKNMLKSNDIAELHGTKTEKATKIINLILDDLGISTTSSKSLILGVEKLL